MLIVVICPGAPSWRGCVVGDRRKVGEKYANYNEKLDTLHAKQQQEQRRWRGRDFPECFSARRQPFSPSDLGSWPPRRFKSVAGRLSGPNEALALPPHFN